MAKMSSDLDQALASLLFGDDPFQKAGVIDATLLAIHKIFLDFGYIKHG